MFQRLLLVCSAAFCLACTTPIPSNESQSDPSFTVDLAAGEPKPWTDLPPQDRPEDFHFVVVTDRTGGHRPGVFTNAMDKVNLLAPAFVVSVGDLIEGYTENQERIDAEWDEMEGFIGKLDAPFFYTPGNHDMNNAVMAETWQRRFGPSFYKFRYKGVLFLVLNSELFGMVGAPDTPLPGPWTQAQQMQFIEDTLIDEQDARWTVVLLHQPLWDAREIDPDWLTVENLLGDRQYTVFAGHFHQYAKRRRHDRNFITLATTGGVSGLRGTLFGEFDHVAWVTMREDGPQIANLLLEGIQDENVSNPEIAKQAQALFNGIKSQANVASGEFFSQAVQSVSISNPTNAPITVTPTVSKPGNFEIAGLQRLTLQAGESQTLDIEMSANPAIAYRDLAAGVISWSMDATIADRDGTITAKSPVLPLTKHPIVKRSKAPLIDGNLDDWGELPYVVAQQGDILGPELTAEDLSYRFAVAEDADNLYVAVAVTDDEVVVDPNALARDQDAITVAIDPRDAAARNRSMGIGEAVLGGDMGKMAMLIQSLGASPDDTLLGFMQPTIEASKTAVVQTPQGYRAEFAIPISHLDAKAGNSDWREVRIVVSVYDRDQGSHGVDYVHWQPYRYNAGALPWTHTFTRQPAKR